MTTEKGGDPINSFLSWIGGKKALRDEILMRFPPGFERYVEVFGGAGWVLFHKPAGPETEIFNDMNKDLANLYRCVRTKPEDLIAELEFAINSRLDFGHIKDVMRRPDRLPDVRRAALFYRLIRYSYASGLKSYANIPHSMWGNFPLIRDACARLQRVVIENRDFESLISLYDGDGTFFYLDPPYYRTEDYYRGVSFGEPDHCRLADSLRRARGRFLLSYNDHPVIRDMYSRPGITVESVSRLSNLAQRYEGGKMYAELLIANYDTANLPDRYYQMSVSDLFPESRHPVIRDFIEEREVLHYG